MKARMVSAQLVTSRARFYPKLVVLALFLFIGALSVSSTPAQQQMSKRYPAQKNVRIVLKNISGTITVESWNRDEIKLSMVFESPKANVAPRHTGAGLMIDVMADNPGRSDVGDVNFKLQVPLILPLIWKQSAARLPSPIFVAIWCGLMFPSKATLICAVSTLRRYMRKTRLETFILTESLRERELISFNPARVDITIRIPAESAFHLTAAAPTKQIALGQFWNDKFKNLGGGRKYEGEVVDGRSKVMVTNFKAASLSCDDRNRRSVK